MYGRPPERAARPADETLLRRIARGCNLPAADAPRIFSEFVEVDQGQFFSPNALQALDRAGADMAGAAHLAATARALSWRTRDAAEVLRVAAAAEDLLAVTADGLAALAAELARLGADPLLVGPALVEVLGRHESAWHAVERAEARRKRAEEDLARVEGRERAARLRLRELEAVLKRASDDQKVVPWLSASDARLAKAAYEGRVKLG